MKTRKKYCYDLMQQLFSQYNPVLLQIRYATTKCQSDKKRPYHQRFFLFHQKLQKQRDFGALFGVGTRSMATQN